MSLVSIVEECFEDAPIRLVLALFELGTWLLLHETVGNGGREQRRHERPRLKRLP
jgi:hypothetical protein